MTQRYAFCQENAKNICFITYLTQILYKSDIICCVFYAICKKGETSAMLYFSFNGNSSCIRELSTTERQTYHSRLPELL